MLKVELSTRPSFEPSGNLVSILPNLQLLPPSLHPLPASSSLIKFILPTTSSLAALLPSLTNFNTEPFASAFVFLIITSGFDEVEEVTVRSLPSNVRFASPFRASDEENVAILLSEPLATAETAPPPPAPVAAIVIDPLPFVIEIPLSLYI